MAVLERSELQASPLADLHAIADQLGLDGFRRLRKAELIDAILRAGGPARDESGEHLEESGEPGEDQTSSPPFPWRIARRASRTSRGRVAAGVA